MNKEQTGYTLLEVMVCIIFLGVLVVLSFPAYKDYTIKNQIAEGVELSRPAREATDKYFETTGQLPHNKQEDKTIPNLSSKYIQDVSVGRLGDGSVSVKFGEQSKAEIKNKTLIMNAVPTQAGNLKWACQAPGLESSWLPKECEIIEASQKDKSKVVKK